MNTEVSDLNHIEEKTDFSLVKVPKLVSQLRALSQLKYIRTRAFQYYIQTY